MINNFYFIVIASKIVLSASSLFKVVLIRHPGKWLGHHQLGQLLRGLLHLHLCGSSQLCRLDYDYSIIYRISRLPHNMITWNAGAMSWTTVGPSSFNLENFSWRRKTFLFRVFYLNDLIHPKRPGGFNEYQSNQKIEQNHRFFKRKFR